jgi:hypothetical protein
LLLRNSGIGDLFLSLTLFVPFFPFVLETHKIHLFLHLAFVSVCTTQIASLETISKLWVPWRSGFGLERQNQGISPCHTRPSELLLAPASSAGSAAIVFASVIHFQPW